MSVGNWGSEITFEVSDKKVLTFAEMKRTVSGRYKQHPIIGKKPKSEFAGPEAAQIELSGVVLSAEHGVKPLKTLKKLEKAVEKGKAEYLFIGGKKIGKNKFVITSMSEAWEQIWNKGELARASVDLSLVEYK